MIQAYNYCRTNSVLKFMNNNPSTRYEHFRVPDKNWNNTGPEGKREGTRIATVEGIIKILKDSYGTPSDPNNPDIMTLPPNFGTQNADFIGLWIQAEKLSAQYKAELNME